MITVGLVCLSEGRRQSLEVHRLRLGNWMQNFSQCKSRYPCKSATWFSTCFHASYILPTSAILCQHTRIWKHAWCSLISSWTFVLLALHLASLFLARLFLSSDLGLSTLAIPYPLPHPALFSLFGLNAPTSWSRFVLFWFSWTSLSMSWTSLSIMIFGCLFWSGLKPLLSCCVHGQSPGQGEGPVVGLAADCSVGPDHKSFPALCGQLVDHVPGHELHPWVDFHVLAVVSREYWPYACGTNNTKSWSFWGKVSESTHSPEYRPVVWASGYSLIVVLGKTGANYKFSVILLWARKLRCIPPLYKEVTSILGRREGHLPPHFRRANCYVHALELQHSWPTYTSTVFSQRQWLSMTRSN